MPSVNKMPYDFVEAVSFCAPFLFMSTLAVFAVLTSDTTLQKFALIGMAGISVGCSMHARKEASELSGRFEMFWNGWCLFFSICSFGYAISTMLWLPLSLRTSSILLALNLPILVTALFATSDGWKEVFAIKKSGGPS